ncbi:hypothetical protein QYH69_25160 [Paraburkholderia sp. SARCC-3016]|uniref:hypothetical protein n=1 Tax=Paraburkholderia sp. SARCC-3016 TaxID=3058611 RepID=UPI0028084942|nr:hypothetical protein [Paraburkholderia sp. SARCC-3016]MDQ7980531.1 hypothetical protein [Paraburkholderia sp. SARCC-3016]
MPHSMKKRWSGLLKPIGFAHRDEDGGKSRDAAAPHSSQAHEAGERLERIAMYARAGYFNMGYTLDMMQAPGEILPD